MGTTSHSKLFPSKTVRKTRKQSVILTITDCFLAGAQGLEP